jgi:hypothetical protein
MVTADAFTGNTAWAREMPAALRNYLQTEAGSAFVLVAGALAALAWANLPGGLYETVWTTHLSVRLGPWGISEELRRWVNDGLMTFFFVVGLEIRRELDMGELRERRRVAVPVIAALGGMSLPRSSTLRSTPAGRAWAPRAWRTLGCATERSRRVVSPAGAGRRAARSRRRPG